MSRSGFARRMACFSTLPYSMTTRAAWIGVLLCVTACTAKQNYSVPAGPRYAGGEIVRSTARHADTLRVVSFNIEFAYNVDSAISVLKQPSLRDADVVLLQEMDADATARIARALGMAYVYYPATLHPRTRRDFGNALLSRFPIIADSKILLPHISALRRTQRSATAATIRVDDSTVVRVYSAHLGTIADVSPEQRREQLRAIIADAASYERVIMGGDMNDPFVGEVAKSAGYRWVTEGLPFTSVLGPIDHIFLKGIAGGIVNGAGVVSERRGASDHKPIWALAIIR